MLPWPSGAIRDELLLAGLLLRMLAAHRLLGLLGLLCSALLHLGLLL